jgi:uncharacterized protein HemX
MWLVASALCVGVGATSDGVCAAILLIYGLGLGAYAGWQAGRILRAKTTRRS